MSCKIGSECQIVKNGIDLENYTVPVILSDESEVKRYNWEDGEYFITLEHTDSSIDLKRAEILGMFINHNTYELPIAKFTNVRIEDKKLKADAVFDKDDADSLKIFNKLAKGFLQSFSIGAEIEEKVLIKEDGDKKYYKATKWSIHECSLVSVPAIPNAKVGLNKNMGTIPPETEKIVDFKKGDFMELSEADFDKLKLERLNLEKEIEVLNGKLRDSDIKVAKFSNKLEKLEKISADKREIMGLIFEFGLKKDEALALFEKESIGEANSEMLNYLKTNKATFNRSANEDNSNGEVKEQWQHIKKREVDNQWQL